MKNIGNGGKCDEVHNQKQVETFYNGYGRGWGWRRFGGGGMATTSTYDQRIGNLVVDIFSTKNKQLLWRGMTQRDLSTNSDKNTKALNSDIDKMLKNFPPKGSSASGE
jgi:hypothetical protein